MYRHRKVGSKKLEAMRAASRPWRMATEVEPRPLPLPNLRRRITVEDFDFGHVTHTIELFKTGRIDCYRAVADGVEWKRRIGWSGVLEAVRKSFVRVMSERNL